MKNLKFFAVILCAITLISAIAIASNAKWWDENPFTDVKSKDYFYNAVLWAVKNKITAGTTATTFEPNSPCTRGQIVAFLYRAYN